MGISDITFAIHNAIQRHTSPLEEIHFLLVHSCNRMFGIGQADKGNLFILPVLLKCRTGIRANRHDQHITICEFFVFITQARQLRAAIGSHKAAQERKHDWPAAQSRETHMISLHIIQFKIRSRFTRGNEFTHVGAILWFSPKFRQTYSQLIFLSMYFAGSGGRNTEPIRHSPADRARHEQI